MLQTSLAGRLGNSKNKSLWKDCFLSPKQCKSMAKTAFCMRPAHGEHRYLTKFLLVMKLTALLLTVSFLNVSAKGISQNVTFSAERVPLQFVLSSVEKQTGFVFVYFGSVLDNARPVTIHVTDVPLEKFLAELFKPQPLVFEFKGKNILISSKFTSAEKKHKLNGKFYIFKDSLIAVKGIIDSDQGPVNGLKGE